MTTIFVSILFLPFMSNASEIVKFRRQHEWRTTWVKLSNESIGEAYVTERGSVRLLGPLSIGKSLATVDTSFPLANRDECFSQQVIGQLVSIKVFPVVNFDTSSLREANGNEFTASTLENRPDIQTIETSIRWSGNRARSLENFFNPDVGFNPNAYLNRIVARINQSLKLQMQNLLSGRPAEIALPAGIVCDLASEQLSLSFVAKGTIERATLPGELILSSERIVQIAGGLKDSSFSRELESPVAFGLALGLQIKKGRMEYKNCPLYYSQFLSS